MWKVKPSNLNPMYVDDTHARLVELRNSQHTRLAADLRAQEDDISRALTINEIEGIIIRRHMRQINQRLPVSDVLEERTQQYLYELQQARLPRNGRFSSIQPQQVHDEIILFEDQDRERYLRELQHRLDAQNRGDYSIPPPDLPRRFTRTMPGVNVDENMHQSDAEEVE